MTFDPEDLVYFGAVMASISHEMKNVCTIINESAGLLDDLSQAAERGRALDPQRLRRLAGDIARNVERGVAIINQMNRFSHSVDEPLRSVELGQLLTDLTAMARRFRKLRSAQIQLTLPGAPVTIQSDAFGLHQLLMRLCELLAQSGSATLALSLAAAADGGATITIEHDPAISPATLATHLQTLAPLVAQVSAAARNGEGTCTVILELPPRPYNLSATG